MCHSTYVKIQDHSILFPSRKRKEGELPYFTSYLSLLYEYFMNYTACIIQSQAMIFLNFLIYFPEQDWDLSVPGTNLMEPILE